MWQKWHFNVTIYLISFPAFNIIVKLQNTMEILAFIWSRCVDKQAPGNVIWDYLLFFSLWIGPTFDHVRFTKISIMLDHPSYLELSLLCLVFYIKVQPWCITVSFSLMFCLTYETWYMLLSIRREYLRLLTHVVSKSVSQKCDFSWDHGFCQLHCIPYSMRKLFKYIQIYFISITFFPIWFLG